MSLPLLANLFLRMHSLKQDMAKCRDATRRVRFRTSIQFPDPAPAVALGFLWPVEVGVHDVYPFTMAYGVELRPPQFESLCVEVPALRHLENDVIRCTEFLSLEDPRPTTQDDTDSMWYRLFKPRLVELVGYYAKNDSPCAGTTGAYDAATSYLYRSLAPSNETLGENSKADEYRSRYEREMESWDGDEDMRPEFITTETVMRTVVARLGLPTTEAYEQFTHGR